MEEVRRIYHVYLSFDQFQVTARLKDICCKTVCPQRVSILEQLIPKLWELGL